MTKSLLLSIVLTLLVNISFATTYYIRPTGLNSNDGTSPSTAWFDFTNINNKNFVAGDIIYIEQGFTYFGKITFDAMDLGTSSNPIRVTSWNATGALTGRATINSGPEAAIYAYNTAGIKISDINVIGNTTIRDGITFYCDLPNNIKKEYISIQNIDVKGFRNGVFVGSYNENSGFSNVTIKGVNAYENSNCGITSFAQGKLAHTNLLVTYCKAYNNYGDLNNTASNSGNGIVLGGVDGGIISHCIAYNNGQNNNHLGGGPVGIWCYQSNNVIIEYNESYNNKAGRDADGGGFDIDGGSTNCIMQYNYSHDNEGPGYTFAQYNGALPMSNNICRYNISENDGRKNSYGAITLFAAGGHSISDTQIYGNTVYVSATSTALSALMVITGSNTINTSIKNNIFLTDGQMKMLNIASTSGIQIQGNCYWSFNNNYDFTWGTTSYNGLATFKSSGQEANSGLQVNPMLTNPNAGITIGNPDLLSTLNAYKLKDNSPLIDAGQTINNPGLRDFYGSAIPQNNKFDIGAHELLSTPDIESPSVPSNLTIGTLTHNSLRLSWTVSTDNVGVTGYEIYRDDVMIGSSTTTTYNVSGLTAATTYAFKVVAKDAAGNTSSQSSGISVTTLAAPDTQVPTVPSGLLSSNITVNSFTLSWIASTDNVGVVSYEVFRGGVSQGTSTTTSMNITGLTASSTYSMRVVARDAAGNVSAQSAALAVTTPPDTQSPTAPINLSSSNITQTSFMLSWTGSTDNVGVVSYEVFRDGISIGTSSTTTMNVSNLTAGTSYKMAVKAKDAAGNESTSSTELTVTTLAVPVSTILKAHNILTPNGDGQNDVWMIEGMGLGIRYEVKVYDPTGRQVYNSINYSNDWDGTYKGQKLANGAYYYTITSEGNTIKGFLTILN